MTISEHISFSEATYSQEADIHGIRNIPSLDEIHNMKLLAKKVFEPLRAHIGKPIRINSFFRSQDLNREVGGSFTSQHSKGQAMDISSMDDSYSNADIFRFIRDNLPFDQLIWEFGDDHNPQWVHVSYCEKNRSLVLKSVKESGKTKYITI
jgi:zinc D-Ala-D-Ala carboxypeptidase